MEESTTYQAIIRKGRVAEARRMLFLLGQKRLGSADEAATATVNALRTWSG